MFLKKIVGIKAVGRFRTGGIRGGEYEKYTLFYGGNGRGKTTLCAVLRSLQTNDPSHVLKRRTFKSNSAQEVQLLFDSGLVMFSAGAWSASIPDLHIFDQHFINANVHGGHQIDVVHRRNFYRVVVGPTGVGLAEQIDHLDASATSRQQEITAEKKVLQQHVPTGMNLETFLKLQADADIDAKISAAEKTVKAVNAAADIAARTKLKAVVLPTFPAEFEALMAKGLPGIAVDAAALVQSQLDAHNFHDKGESWLATGLAHVRKDACPFCGASVTANPLIAAYQYYFSDAYNLHKAALDKLAQQLDGGLGQAAGLRASQGFKDAERDAAFWSAYVEHGYVNPIESEYLFTHVDALYTAASARLASKIAAPLDDRPATLAYLEASSAWSKTRQRLEEANVAMVIANAAIDRVKEANANTNKTAAIETLMRLKAAKARHSAPFADLACGYEALLKEKSRLVADKEAMKNDLDLYDAEILGSYEKAINAILARFNAGFRLAKCGKNYVGKIPQSAFCLQFDGNNVDISKTDGDEPSFDSTMSAGDKSTFALAFFLAQLDRDPDLRKKVVVFDDPFSSLDDFRREMTAKAIVRVGVRASQVLVFSHDKHFLDTVRRKIHDSTYLAMQISCVAGNSVLEPWDIEREVKEGYLQDHMSLADFANGVTTNAEPIRTIMRPLLEQYIRYRFPNEIRDGLWLGDMLAIIRADENHPLMPQYTELEDINEYTAPFHHDPNAFFSPDEVLAHAKRTVAIVGGC